MMQSITPHDRNEADRRQKGRNVLGAAKKWFLGCAIPASWLTGPHEESPSNHHALSRVVMASDSS